MSYPIEQHDVPKVEIEGSGDLSKATIGRWYLCTGCPLDAYFTRGKVYLCVDAGNENAGEDICIVGDDGRCYNGFSAIFEEA